MTFIAHDGSCLSQNETLTIIFSGNIRGRIHPLKWCGADPHYEGGLSRRSTMIQWLKTGASDMILLDCGGNFSNSDPIRSRQAELIVNALKKMHYSAFTLSYEDLKVDVSFLNRLREDADLPLVTTNLVLKETGQPFGKPYLIFQVGRFKVGVLGVLSDDARDETNHEKVPENLRILSPVQAVQETVSKIRDQVDLVVLLSQLKLQTSVLLANTMADIDFIITGSLEQDAASTMSTTSPKILLGGFRGTSLGVALIEPDASGKLSNKRVELIPLDDSVSADAEVSRMIYDTYTELERQEQQKAMEAEVNTFYELHKEELQLSPEEYLKKIQAE
jgi:2',3'-cyclic-nucleotide 2'-phosphodiesterase (5'-nucleotidase family)